MSIDYSGLSERYQDQARAYISKGAKLGQFLSALVCNEFWQAAQLVDDDQRENLWDIMQWFCLNAPSQCWGSLERRDAWMAARAAERTEKGGAGC